MVTILHNLVESNGLTIKQNNEKKQHKFPIGSLVEITTNSKLGEHSSVYKGVRLFVVEHVRDCDGSPLYNLSFDVNAAKIVEKEHIDYVSISDNPALHSLFLSAWKRAEGMISKHWGEESLALAEDIGR